MRTFETTITVAGRELTLELIEGDHISETVRSTGDFYERGMLDDITRRTRPGDLVVDVGAYIGNHSVFFSGVADLRVIAIEPYPDSSFLLRRNIARNRLEHMVEVHEVAAGAIHGSGSLVVPDEPNFGMVRVEPGLGELEVRTLDEMVSGADPRVIKIDVEGMEPAVLAGAHTIVAAARPLIYAEVTDILVERAVRQWMEEHEYTFIREFNQTATQLYIPEENPLPVIYPPTLSTQAAEQAHALAQLTRAVQEMSAVGRSQTREVHEYREQLRRTTSLFSELYKRIRSMSGVTGEMHTMLRELHDRIKKWEQEVNDD